MIVFSLVAHQDEAGVMAQIENLRKFIRRPFMVVLYNGGSNPHFGKLTALSYNEVKLCPYSRPLSYRRTGRVLYDVTRWLRDEGIKYDFIVYLESDTMFIRKGFDKYLYSSKMKGYDCTAQHWSKYNPKKDDPGSPGTKTMFKHWKKWKKFFGTNYFMKTSNPFQTYRYEMIQKILDKFDGDLFERTLAATDVESLGEMVFPTLAAKHGAKARLYPKSFRRFNRWKPELGKSEVNKAKKKGKYLFIHPVKSSRVRNWVLRNV